MLLLYRLNVTRGSLLVTTSLKMSLLSHHVLLICLTDQMAGCMLFEENVVMKLLHVMKCVHLQVYELKIHKQPIILLGNALGLFMSTLIAPLLVMVSLQNWD